MEAFVESNTLQREGKTPFHLQVSFQVFDLAGNASEQGTLEYWWAGPAGFRLDISSPSLGTVHNVRLNEVQSATGRRTLYLADELLNGIRFPATSVDSRKGPMITEKRQFGKLELQCIDSRTPTATSNFSGVCTDNTSGTVRLVLAPGFSMVRDRPGLFAGTHVALDVAIRWEGKDAITGHVNTLQGFKPEASTVALTQVSPADPSKTPTKPYVRLAGSVIAGHRLSGADPMYPFTARQRRVQGTVLLIARISPEGDLTDLVPLASPDESLTQAAIEAVKTWKYRPYLLNGAPVEVSTTLTVNFTLSRNPS